MKQTQTTEPVPHRGMVLIPAFNEAGRIGAVIDRVRQVIPGWRVVVIDDGSADGTTAVARSHGAEVLELVTNQGYGIALQTGYVYAEEEGAEVVVQLDADGQHDPASIPDLVEALESSGADVVVGSRYLTESYTPPLVRRLGHRFFRAILNSLTSHRYTDPTSGFQVIARSGLWFFTSEVFPHDYPDANVILMLERAGLRCIEAPAVFAPSPPGKVSMHSSWKPIYYIIRMILSLGLTLIRPRPMPGIPRQEEARDEH